MSEQTTHQFQAEVSRLLHLLSHSLYQSREIALRELISNASDALDKIRYQALTNPQLGDLGPLEITIEADDKARTLTISDTGIGMTRDEMIANLGTIAKSGSLEFLKQNSSEDANKAVSLIGQFGVGFYSAFMIADKVSVTSRSYSSDETWTWESTGEGSFSIAEAASRPRGTTIVLHLRENSDDFAQEWHIKQLINRYSAFITFPIMIGGKQVNTIRPIWVEPKSKVTDEDYQKFFEHLSHRVETKPIWRLHMSVDSPIQFHAVLFCPPKNEELMGLHRYQQGVHLCAKRILVQHDNTELLPEYLRFLVGLVDSEDLPLNISRESLQDNTIFRKIRQVLVKRILDQLQALAEEKPTEYGELFLQFGSILKEGIVSEWDQRERIAKLMRFRSTKTIANNPDEASLEYVSLDQYKANAVALQDQIYFLTGPSLEAIRHHPRLEAFKARNIEVLLMTDPVDEFVVQSLDQYDGWKFIAADSDQVKMPGGLEKPTVESNAGLDRVLSLFRTALKDDVTEVRLSPQMTESAVSLVRPMGAMSPQMIRLARLQSGDQQFDDRRIMEVNPQSKLIERLAQISANESNADFIKRCAQQLHANARLLEGGLVNAHEQAARISDFMLEAAGSRSSIVLS